MKGERYTCPCCGYMTLGDWPGSYEVCHVCFWEDDLVQLLDPWSAGGANVPSLVQSQANFESCGAMEPRFVGKIRSPLPSEIRDPQWRKVTPEDRAFASIPKNLTDEEFEDLGKLYYWRQHAA